MSDDFKKQAQGIIMMAVRQNCWDSSTETAIGDALRSAYEAGLVNGIEASAAECDRWTNWWSVGGEGSRQQRTCVHLSEHIRKLIAGKGEMK